MTESNDPLVDTGFDDAIAGNVWKDPAPPAVTATVISSESEEITGLNLITPADNQLTPEGEKCLDEAIEKAMTALTKPDDALIQATKALVHLPPIDVPTMAKLARDVAMDIKERHVILKDFNLTQAQYDYLETYNEFFKNALAAASIEWHAPLSTAERIKVEAAAILEDSLPGLGARMQNKSEGLPGVIEAAKLFAKVAGVGERENGGAGSGERFTITIDLGGDQKINVSAGAPAVSAAGQSGTGAIQEDAQVSGGLPPIQQQS